MREQLQRALWWVIGLPVALSAGYWTFLQTLDVDGTWTRLTMLPNPIFDWWFYMQLFERDLLDHTGILFQGLAPFMRLFFALIRPLWFVLHPAEIYFITLIISFTATIWLFSVLLQRIGGLVRTTARWSSIIIFLFVQASLGFRPGASSWYIPFFLTAILFAWTSWTALSEGRTRRSLVLAAIAIFFSLTYPWFFMLIVTGIALLFFSRFVTLKRAVIGVAVVAIMLTVAVFLQSRWLPGFVGSMSVEKALRGGMGLSYLPIVSNAIPLFLLWMFAWLGMVKLSPHRASFFVAMWAAQALLWFQNMFTGIALIPDHFVYTAWILSALSWGVWWETSKGLEDVRWKKILHLVGLFAALFALWILFGLFTKYTLKNVGGLIIHLGSWSFLAFALLTTGQKTKRLPIAFAWGVFLTVLGLMGSTIFARQETKTAKNYSAFASWVRPHVADRSLVWCSDWDAEQVLAPNTGLVTFPNDAAMLEPVTDQELQQRIIAFSAFFHSSVTDQGWRIERQLLFSADLMCDLNARMRSIVERFVKSQSLRDTLIGCNREKTNKQKEALKLLMERQWSAPVPATSVVCDRFIIRNETKDAWRMPTTYHEMYRDSFVTVYGK